MQQSGWVIHTTVHTEPAVTQLREACLPDRRTLAVSGVFFFVSCCVEASDVSCAHDTLLGGHAPQAQCQSNRAWGLWTLGARRCTTAPSQSHTPAGVDASRQVPTAPYVLTPTQAGALARTTPSTSHGPENVPCWVLRRRLGADATRMRRRTQTRALHLARAHAERVRAGGD